MIGQQFQGLGSNSVTVQSYTALADALQGKQLATDAVGLRPRSAYRVERHLLDHADHVRRRTARRRSATARRPRSPKCSARPTRIKTSASTSAQRGRFLSDSDNDTRRRVAVIGSKCVRICRCPRTRSGSSSRSGRVAQDHRPARGEGRDLGPEPGQSRHDSVHHDGEPCRASSAQPDIAIQLTLGEPGRSREHAPNDHPAAAHRAQAATRRRGRLQDSDGPAAPGHFQLDPDHRDDRDGRAS